MAMAMQASCRQQRIDFASQALKRTTFMMKYLVFGTGHDIRQFFEACSTGESCKRGYHNTRVSYPLVELSSKSGAFRSLSHCQVLSSHAVLTGCCQTPAWGTSQRRCTARRSASSWGSQWLGGKPPTYTDPIKEYKR